MLFDSNPGISSLHNNWREKIISIFGDYINAADYIPLFLINYINSSPQKYYCKISFNEYYSFLNDQVIEDKFLFDELLNECSKGISNANNILIEVNKEDFHEMVLPSDHIEQIEFIDKYVHYWLLRLYEGVIKPMIYPIAKHSRIKRGVDFKGLDTYNCFEELRISKFAFIYDSYSSIIRNGIAHGSISYLNFDVIYNDKDKSESYTPIEIVALFDRALDISNGFMCALKAFYFSNLNNLPVATIPVSLLMEELQYQADAPGWKIQRCIESSNNKASKQLNIYVQNHFWSPMKVMWGCYYLAYWSIKLLKQYNRVFISLNSRHSLNGWADFNGSILNENINLVPTESLEWLKEINEGGIMFKPFYKFPKIVYKVGTWRSIINSQFKKLKENNKKNNAIFVIKDLKHHTVNHDLIINNASIILNENNLYKARNFIKENHVKIAKKVIKSTRTNYSWFSPKRYYPIKIFRIFIYDTDQRIRNRRNAGLIPELIAAISYNNKKYHFPDLLNSEKEILGKHKIFWHLDWSGNKEIQM
jgi:hypothetical protein